MSRSVTIPAFLLSLTACEPAACPAAPDVDAPAQCSSDLIFDPSTLTPLFQVALAPLVPDGIAVAHYDTCDALGATLTPVWVVDGLGSALVDGVTYGVAPEGAEEAVPPTPLLQGEQYGVQLTADGGLPRWTATFLAGVPGSVVLGNGSPCL